MLKIFSNVFDQFSIINDTILVSRQLSIFFENFTVWCYDDMRKSIFKQDKSCLFSWLGSFLGFFGFLLLFLFLGLFWFFFFGCGIDLLFYFFESVHGDLGSGCNTGCKLKGSSGKGNFASFAFPDSTSNSFYLSLNDESDTFPHGGQTYLARCWSSNFLTIFLMVEPYRVPYLPVTPTFLVLLAIISQY